MELETPPPESSKSASNQQKSRLALYHDDPSRVQLLDQVFKVASVCAC